MSESKPRQMNSLVCSDAGPLFPFTSHNRCAFWGAAVFPFMSLQPCQPRHELVVSLPRIFAAGLGRDQFFGRLKRFTFHLQIDFNVGVGGFNGGVAQPGTDHIQINIGLEQMHRRGMAPSVWRHLAGEQGRTHIGGVGNSMSNDVPQAETGEPIVMDVDEKRNGCIQAHGACGQVGLEGLDGLSPQRAGSFFTAFAEDPHQMGTAEADVVDIQAHQFLRAHSRVIEQPEQAVVTAPQRRPAVDLREDLQHFLPFQVFRHVLGVAFERDCENRLAVGQIAWFGLGDVLKEGMNGGQPVVSGRHRVVPFVFQVIQKAAHCIGSEFSQC